MDGALFLYPSNPLTKNLRMPCRVKQCYDHDSFCSLLHRVDDFVGKFFRVSPTDISLR
jgi:hypothetical protein